MIMSTTHTKKKRLEGKIFFLLILTTQLQTSSEPTSPFLVLRCKKETLWEDWGSVRCMYVSMADVIFGIDYYAMSSLIVIVCKLLAVQIELQSKEEFEHDYKTES